MYYLHWDLGRIVCIRAFRTRVEAEECWREVYVEYQVEGEIVEPADAAARVS